jgi:cyclophilin family peptidyl-prolyl cis-trans isomerase
MAHQQWGQPPAMGIDPGRRYTTVIETTQGTIRAELFPGDAPKTVNNFVFLARQGYYDGVPFHRVIRGFMIQTGDPTGTGSGGPGYRFEDEPIRRDYAAGTLAMANAGPNTNGSQFFICHHDLRGRLPKSYTIFGQVTEGMDVVNQLADVPVLASRSGEASSPSEPIRIDRVTIEEAGP